jgi:hypothetical protein
MRSRLSLILAGLGVVVLVGLAVLLFVNSDGDDDDGDTDSSLPAAQTVPPPITGELSAEAQELIALLDRGASGTYHAVYAVEGADAAQAGTTSIELWRDGERSRRDAHVETEEGTADTVGIVDGDTAVACQRTGDEPFTCIEAETPEAVDSDVVGSIRSQLTGAGVQPRDDEIDGREVRCFAFSTEDGPAEVCATEEGVVVRLGTDSNALRLTELDDDVPGDVFTPPAEVTAPAEG